MILLDPPYISNYLLDTLERQQFPVVSTPYAQSVGAGRALAFVEEAEAVRQMEGGEAARLYTPSENSIGWISRNLGHTPLPERIARFKNKAKFRSMIGAMYPDFYCREADIPTLLTLSPSDVPLPCVVKPATGFFSLGVWPIMNEADFYRMQRDLQADAASFARLYPEEVLNARTFLIEEFIDGEEFAVDAFFDDEGTPVVMGVFKHIFASERDVSDRVYMTSADIVRENLEPFTALLARIGALAGARRFPMHVELRRRKDGAIIPIEVNPMRFGGWCSTPDLARYAWKMNVYEHFFLDRKPDWPRMLSEAGPAVFSLIVLDNSTGFRGEEIAGFDYRAVCGRFSRVLELRKADFRRYPLFGFLFAETSVETYGELETIVSDDLKSYVSVR